jgi:hypothetical protein
VDIESLRQQLNGWILAGMDEELLQLQLDHWMRPGADRESLRLWYDGLAPEEKEFIDTECIRAFPKIGEQLLAALKKSDRSRILATVAAFRAKYGALAFGLGPIPLSRHHGEQPSRVLTVIGRRPRGYRRG